MVAGGKKLRVSGQNGKGERITQTYSSGKKIISKEGEGMIEMHNIYPWHDIY